MSKENKQIMMLTVVLCGIIGLLVYFNIDRFRPRSDGSSFSVPALTKLNIDTQGAEDLFGRTDYLGLKEYGLVPVRPLGLGNDEPFMAAADEELIQ